ncbi:flagellar motor protein MotB [Aquisalimonas lutea]|uniref:flagellar motor protein MotB n=1 Tax=Aquisalimonas lutea TaxID=1327750 RepID=UPI0025B4A0DF|nr:flagellar motor protein MotB [Aquisalimonas lutea]MDN3518709.1 flagellar motor protein MotB [Aquisalimonas lutea]
MDDKTQPIVIKRVKKVAGGHHGGSWKVAFADFMTALFAMFLILWIVTAMDEEQRAGVAGYFRDPTNFSQEDNTPGNNIIDLEGGSQTPLDMGDSPAEPTEEQIMEEAERRQRARMESLQQDLEEAIERSQALEPFKDQLLLDITPEGLRIQLVDRRNRPMFDLGSDDLRNYAESILMELADVINEVPNKISITGHTDSVAFTDPETYDNWELSADRANSARRALMRGGINVDRIAQVTGLADTVLFDKDNPQNPINRRISIVVLNPDAEAAIAERQDARQFTPAGDGADNGD